MTPSAKKTDLRKIRSKKMIIDAFLTLVAKKGLDAVTIQDIADEAMINRGTFYAHFSDKQDLYDEILDYAVDAFASIISKDQLIHGRKIKLQHVENVLTNIYLNIKKNKAFFLTLTDGNAIGILKSKLADLLYVKYQDIFDSLKITENNLEVPIDFIIEYMTSIFMGTLHWWLTTDSEMPPEALARLVIKLVANGHLTVMGIEVDQS